MHSLPYDLKSVGTPTHHSAPIENIWEQTHLCFFFSPIPQIIHLIPKSSIFFPHDLELRKRNINDKTLCHVRYELPEFPRDQRMTTFLHFPWHGMGSWYSPEGLISSLPPPAASSLQLPWDEILHARHFSGQEG